MLDVYKHLLGLGARVNWMNPSTSFSGQANVLTLEGQVAWFIHAPEVVLKARYAWIEQKAPDPDAVGTFVLPHPAGTTSIATLQLNVVF